METTDPLEALVAGQIEGAPTTTLETLAAKLGLKLDRKGRVHLGRALKKRGWKRRRQARGGKVYAWWEPAELDPDDRALRAYLAGRDNVTIGECCYALRWLPDPNARARISAWLAGYGWRPHCDRPDEFDR